MLVVIHRHGAAILLEYFGALLEKLIPRVENLALFITWVVAVFGDQEHAIHRKFLSAQTQCFRYGGVNLEAEFTGALPAQIALRLLVYVKRHHLHVGLVPD